MEAIMYDSQEVTPWVVIKDMVLMEEREYIPSHFDDRGGFFPQYHVSNTIESYAELFYPKLDDLGKNIIFEMGHSGIYKICHDVVTVRWEGNKYHFRLSYMNRNGFQNVNKPCPYFKDMAYKDQLLFAIDLKIGGLRFLETYELTHPSK